MDRGNANELRDASEGPRKSYLFFFTVTRPESSLSGEGAAWLVKLGAFAGSGAHSMALENLREIYLTPGRTDNRSRSPRLTASS